MHNRFFRSRRNHIRGERYLGMIISWVNVDSLGERKIQYIYFRRGACVVQWDSRMVIGGGHFTVAEKRKEKKIYSELQ